MSSSCGPDGGNVLVRDIEEMVGDVAGVECWGCIAKCGEGPNVEIAKDGKKAADVKGIRDFASMEELLKTQLGNTMPSLSSTARKVAKLKFEARRLKQAAQREEKLQEAFKLLGGDSEKVAANEPKLLSELLVLRSDDRLKSDAAGALLDAEKAVQLTPNRAVAHLALGVALDKSDRLEEALKAMQTADKLGTGLQKAVMKRKMMGLERKLRMKREEEAEKAGAAAKPPPAEDKPPAAAPVVGPDTASPADKDDFDAWRLEETSYLNHNCLRLVFQREKNVAVEDPRYDIWHVDLLHACELDDEEVIRPYTPVSTMSDYLMGRLELMIKVYPNGRMSSHVAGMKVGDSIMVSSPKKSLDVSFVREGVVMVAGGSAVTVALQVCASAMRISMMSFGRAAPVILALCNNSEKDILYRERFEGLQKIAPRFRVLHCLLEGPVPSETSGKADFRVGPISAAALQPHLQKLREQEGKFNLRPPSVVSGPPGLCFATQKLLVQMGWPVADIRFMDKLPSADDVTLIGDKKVVPPEVAKSLPLQEDNASNASEADPLAKFFGMIVGFVFCRKRRGSPLSNDAVP
eukprot:TRINITY_DN41669_c0_g1_i1.p1 TRINITY_DN41669_c0_g1~~TRINITY_DN41669_c0_g1_i1.p1  ORF type:complete len:617 (-),score=162.70 TRINITY_DN41669_c0_g1_i1:189-1919(-)